MSFLWHHSSKEREMASHFCEIEKVMEIQVPYVDSMDTWNPYPHGLYWHCEEVASLHLGGCKSS